jgi:hypothetical protein
MLVIAKVSWDYHRGAKGSEFIFWKSRSATEGPYIIAEVLKPGTYKLSNEKGEIFTNAWNIEQLRRFFP